MLRDITLHEQIQKQAHPASTFWTSWTSTATINTIRSNRHEGTVHVNNSTPETPVGNFLPSSGGWAALNVSGVGLFCEFFRQYSEYRTQLATLMVSERRQ